jgi:hypothetical protein
MRLTKEELPRVATNSSFATDARATSDRRRIQDEALGSDLPVERGLAPIGGITRLNDCANCSFETLVRHVPRKPEST